MLLNYYIDSFAQENELPPIDLTEGAIKVLQDYRWPGNIRELRNFCENTVVLKRGNELTEYDLDPKYHNQTETPLDDKLRSLSSGPTLCKE
jgi:DNA-binding NtrC family response regulator